MPDDKVAAIMEATLHEKPPGETHWSCRSMTKAQGVSQATVQRVWAALIQALDRTHPSLPMNKVRAGTMTRNYKRKGTTTLFAALIVMRHPPRRVRLGPITDRGHRGAPAGEQRGPQGVRVDRHRRAGPREGASWLDRPRSNHRVKLRHCTSRLRLWSGLWCSRRFPARL